MAPKPGPSYRYCLALPRVFDGPRPDWPRDLMDRVFAIAGVVDATFPEWSAAWHQRAEEMTRSESRRRVIYIDTNHAKAKDADAARDAIAAFARALKAELHVDRVVLLRWPIDIEVV